VKVEERACILERLLTCCRVRALRYVEEMTRVLKPGGTLVIACWCQREETADK
jgi:hypothetical protein